VPVRDHVRRLRSSGVWKPATAAYLLRDRRAHRAASVLPSDEDSLRAAAEWLGRAQEATPDGGISGRYRLAGGWTSSYPETTGYAIPTLLTLAAVLDDDSYRDRAKRAVDFLLSVQLEGGGFPGLEIADNRTEPSPFNTAQIIHGLHEWYRATGDEGVLDAIRLAASWLCDVQDEDGPWRKHWYRGLACAYSSHAACWLADVGDTLAVPRFLDAAKRNLHWVLAQHDPQTGWFDRCGFSDEDHRLRRAHTHTIAYTLDGVLRLAERFGVDAGMAAVRVASEHLLLRLERSGGLAGVLDHQWRPVCGYACLTGNAQIASIWLRLARSLRDLRYANAAFKALDAVKRAQALRHPNPGIRGGIPGSAPIGGEYIRYALPNWAAKFFIDALCAKRECLTSWVDDARQPVVTLASPTAVKPGASAPSVRRVVVYTTRLSPTFATLATLWQTRRFSPALVVIESGRASKARRLWTASRRRPDDSARICRACGWPFEVTASVNDAKAVAAVSCVAPALALAAGAGILRAPLLAIPSLGTLNAHMGLLPAYRGMNVAEWSALNGDPNGCSVFLVDEGIDTGPIVATRVVDATGCATIADLRARVNRIQLELLDEIAEKVVAVGSPPASVPQAAGEGRQYFRLHSDLRAVVERVLASA
jgi:hypothetical protein